MEIFKFKHMKKFLFIASFVLFTFGAYAQQDYENIVDQFFTLYSKEAPEKAVDFLFTTNPYMDINSEQAKKIKVQLGTVTALIGDFFGYELMRKEQLAPSLVSLTYLVKHKRQPLYYTFVFYKPNDKWQILNVRFDDKLENVPLNKNERQ